MPGDHNAFLSDLREVLEVFEPGRTRMTGRELTIVLRTLGMNYEKDEIRRMVTRVDCQGIGSITLPEYVTLVEQIISPSGGTGAEDEMRAIFRMLDVDGKGDRISIKGLRSLYTGTNAEGDPDFDNLLADMNPRPVDPLHLTFEEFIRMFITPSRG